MAKAPGTRKIGLLAGQTLIYSGAGGKKHWKQAGY